MATMTTARPAYRPRPSRFEPEVVVVLLIQISP
jgi:hypothetical protein